ncbi:hypothetical protein PilKf_01480 [Pillotina sp. SPG140]|jgi:hypothetical protein
MAIKTSARAASAANIESVIEEIRQPNVAAVCYFFSPGFEAHAPHKAFKEAFPKASCIGASMNGGYNSTAFIEKGIVALSLSTDDVENSFVAFSEGVKADPVRATESIITDVKRFLGRQKTSPEKYVGIIFFDGLSTGDIVMQRLSVERALNFPIIGGAAADEMNFSRTVVTANTNISSDGIVLLVMKMKIPFYCNQYMHYHPTQHSFIATKTSPHDRIVYELDFQPAQLIYAQAVGVKSVADLNRSVFVKNPCAVVTGDKIFCRSIIDITPDGGLKFYAWVNTGTKMHILQQGDIIEHTRKSLQSVENYLSAVQGGMFFNCTNRFLELKELNIMDSYVRLFNPYNMIGFNTFGEEFFVHLNQTLTIVFFGVP